MNKDDKYVRRAKRIETRIKTYSLLTENMINRLTGNSIAFIDQLLKTTPNDKKKEG